MGLPWPGPRPRRPSVTSSPSRLRGIPETAAAVKIPVAAAQKGSKAPGSSPRGLPVYTKVGQKPRNYGSLVYRISCRMYLIINSTGSKDHIQVRILQTMVCGILLLSWA